MERLQLLRGGEGRVVRKGFLEGSDSTWISKNKNALARWKGEGRHSKQMKSKEQRQGRNEVEQ